MSCPTSTSAGEVEYRNIWWQETPPQSATDGVGTFRSDYQTVEAGTTGEGFIDGGVEGRPFHSSFPEGYRVITDDNESGTLKDYQPPAVNPGTEPNPDGGPSPHPPNDANFSAAPGDATILIEGGQELTDWTAAGGGEVGWSREGDRVAIEPGSGNIQTSESFGDAQIHLEFRIPEGTDSPDSGILLANEFEIQIAGSGTGKQGTGAYTYQAAPLRDATKAAGEWQSFDIIWQGARIENQQLSRPGRVSVLLNGQVVQDRLYLDGPNVGGSVASYANASGNATAPIGLQENGSPVEFKYMWVRPLYPSKRRGG